MKTLTRVEREETKESSGSECVRLAQRLRWSCTGSASQNLAKPAMGELCTQRDLNCLADPDRSTRKRTLEKLAKDVAAGAGKPVFTAEFVKRNLDLLHKPLLKCVRDPAEKCRELSVTILSALLPLVNAADVEAVAGEV